MGLGVTTALLHGDLDESRSWLCNSESDKRALQKENPHPDDIHCLQSRGVCPKHPLIICDSVDHSLVENTLQFVAPLSLGKDTTCVLVVRCPTDDDVTVVATKLGDSVPKLTLWGAGPSLSVPSP